MHGAAGGPPPLPPRPTSLASDRRELLALLLEVRAPGCPVPPPRHPADSDFLQTRGLKPFTAAELDSVDVPALVGALRAGRSFAVAPGRVVPASAAPLQELPAPPARPSVVAAAALGEQQLTQASPFSRRLSAAELSRAPSPR